jgi:hypothetical protein
MRRLVLATRGADPSRAAERGSVRSAGAGSLGSRVAPCGRQRAQAVAGRGPGVQEHQTVHQAPGPASCGWGLGRPSRRRCSSVLGCAEGVVTRHVEVFGFAVHGCSSSSLSIFRRAEDTHRRPNTSLPPYDHAAASVGHRRVTVRTLPSTVSRQPRGLRPARATSAAGPRRGRGAGSAVRRAGLCEGLRPDPRARNSRWPVPVVLVWRPPLLDPRRAPVPVTAAGTTAAPGVRGW